MLVTLTFTVVGALICALASWGSANTVYSIIAFGRTLLGIGVGGIYPLSAVHSAEDEQVDCFLALEICGGKTSKKIRK